MLTEGMPERKECNSTGTQRCRCTAVTTNVFQHWNGCVDNVDLWLSTLAVPKIGTTNSMIGWAIPQKLCAVIL